MTEQQTCGQGLAARSVLPRKLGELLGALAEVLDVHMKALDLDDENALNEHNAYLKLTREHREIAARLEAAAGEMARDRDLPMGVHDQRVMSSAQARDAFARFVRIERELTAQLQTSVEQDQAMLAQMG